MSFGLTVLSGMLTLSDEDRPRVWGPGAFAYGPIIMYSNNVLGSKKEPWSKGQLFFQHSLLGLKLNGSSKASRQDGVMPSHLLLMYILRNYTAI